MRASRPNADLAALTARAIDRLGADDFYDRLLDLLASVAPHDLAALVRYSRNAPPDMILPRVTPSEAMRAYTDHFYNFDPFYNHWTEGGEIGVYRLREMDSRIGHSRYAREFLTAMKIHDEIAVFLPPIGDAAPTLILDRATRAFKPEETARVRQLFSLLAALHRQHLKIIITSGITPAAGPIGQTRPLRLIDRGGAKVFATTAWAAFFDSPDPAIAEALDIISGRGPCSLSLGSHGQLVRTQLPSDFGAAPSGFCDEIIADTSAGVAISAQILPTVMADKLTEREQQVVMLTLRGYPIIEIARRLDLSRGTVKNYRLAIYRKLDITTERELFGELMAASRGV